LQAYLRRKTSPVCACQAPTGGAGVTLLPHQQSPQVELPYWNFQDLLKGKAEPHGSREFLIFPESDRKFTYGEFYALSVAASEWMKARTGGIGRFAFCFETRQSFWRSSLGRLHTG